jgi:hypothetical protein
VNGPAPSASDGAPEGTKAEQPTEETKPTKDPAEHPDGPALPDKFWWQGEPHGLGPIPCRLLSALWGKDSIGMEEVVEQVWGHDSNAKERALTMALTRVNNCLVKAQVPWSYGQKQGFIIKK